MITTEDKTLSQIVNEILQALIDQGGKCTNGEGYCKYSNEKDHHCAIGHLLPKDNQDLMMFDGSIDSLVASGLDLGPNGGFIRDNMNVITLLQNYHDCQNCFEWGKLLKKDLPDLDIGLLNKCTKVLRPNTN